MSAEALTVPEVAAILNVHPQTVHNLIRNGKIPVKPFKVGSQWRFSRRQVDQLLEGGSDV